MEKYNNPSKKKKITASHEDRNSIFACTNLLNCVCGKSPVSYFMSCLINDPTKHQINHSIIQMKTLTYSIWTKMDSIMHFWTLRLGFLLMLLWQSYERLIKSHHKQKKWSNKTPQLLRMIRCSLIWEPEGGARSIHIEIPSSPKTNSPWWK